MKEMAVKHLVLIDPGALRTELFGEALEVFRQHGRVLRARAAEARARAREQVKRAHHARRKAESLAETWAEDIELPPDVRLHVFDSEERALDFLRSRGDPCSAVVFTDLYRNGVSGLALVHALRDAPRLGAVPAVLLATEASAARVDEAWAGGSSAVVDIRAGLPGTVRRVAKTLEFWFRTAAL